MSKLVRFCSECNNMLYPREFRKTRQLYMACRYCENQEDIYLGMVRKSFICRSNDNEELAASIDIEDDPTLPITNEITCKKCGMNEVTYFQSGSYGRDASINFYFACKNSMCRHKWSKTPEKLRKEAI